MNVTPNDHQGGLGKLSDSLKQDIENAIAACAIVPAKGAAARIGATITEALVKAGWSGEVHLSRESKITITSAKKGVGLCLQTGNMSRLYADLLKLQNMFLSGTIKMGVMVVPSHRAARTLGDNIANADRLMRELSIFHKVIHMPLVVFAFD
ncbi:conserved hypothetical protein [Cupriavidus taiwanensis]|uniref:BglII/BstYI family type II restriction endonuclease n=1 Tax=Cupriavidus taiwanensis TaxID=164546 RepID=UPI000E19EDAB|nr:BglII/BstYI family type II restriction endonuclease [Cupriavidus taiwanensis]SPA25378.1 conserved hypothetical protein [Cupriavidus taiwanensis]